MMPPDRCHVRPLCLDFVIFAREKGKYKENEKHRYCRHIRKTRNIEKANCTKKKTEINVVYLLFVIITLSLTLRADREKKMEKETGRERETRRQEWAEKEKYPQHSTYMYI